MDLPDDISQMQVEEVVDRLVRLNEGISEFWRRAEGWAPLEAAQLLSRSRLDWQASLSRTLRLWIRTSSEVAEPGKLILAWVNLGSLVEGTLKWFLSVYYKDYRKSIDRLQANLKSPDKLMLGSLRKFFCDEVWAEDDDFDDWLEHIQQRRNAVHAFRNRDIGTHDEFLQDLRAYLAFLRAMHDRVPYPDDVMTPGEVDW